MFRAEAGLLQVRINVGIFQPEPLKVPSVQAHRRARTLVLKAMIFSTKQPFSGLQSQTALFRAT
jgi:hypothetical protein